MPHYQRFPDGSRRVGQKSRGSTTPGKLKGPSCQASPLDKVICKRNRSYKMPEYDTNPKIQGQYARS